MRCGKKIVLQKQLFVENILRSSKDSDLSLKKKFPKKKKQNDDRLIYIK